MCELSPDVVNEILKMGHIYEVGGAVRDRLLLGNRTTSDRDYLVTGISYEDLTRTLQRFGRVNLVGKSFGVIKFTQFEKGRPITSDITLPRTEHSTGLGHRDFEVKYDPTLPLEDDLVRRDFTINAMALALDSEEIVDPLNGRRDLQQRVIRMVYPQSFIDDPLRMMRAVQFAARLEFEIEPVTFEAMRQHARLIETVSRERLAEELSKLLTLAAKPSPGFRLMADSGLLSYILPELHQCMGVQQPGGYHKYDVFEHTLHTIDACPPKLALRLAALLHDINKPQTRRLIDKGATFYGHEAFGARTAGKVLKRLRYSHDLAQEVAILVERHMFTTEVGPKGLRRLIKRVGVPLIFDLLDLRRADVIAQGMGGSTDDVDRFEQEIRRELDRRPPFSISDLALDGHAVMEQLGLEPGPLVGKILDHLLERVLDDPELNTAAGLAQLADEYYKSLTDNSNCVSNKESDL